MKTITNVKYECGDGTRYEDEGKAKAHELKLWFAEKCGAGEGRLTAPAMLDLICGNQQMIIDRLQEDMPTEG